MTGQQPQQKPQPSKTVVATGGALCAAVGAVCAAIVMPFVSDLESGGKQHLSAYHGAADPPGVWTICDGDTAGVRPGQVETSHGCAIRLDKRLAAFAAPVLVCTPALKGHPYQTAAALSLAYNIGVKAYCASTADRMFDAKRWSAACDAFLLFNRANGVYVQGLANRRMRERQLCLTQLPA